MKRILVAIAILLSVSTLCVITHTVQTNGIDKLLTIVDQMQDAYDNEKTEKCLELSEFFLKEFDSNTKLFPFFMRHSDVSKIEETAITLPVMLKTNDLQHFAAELVRCRNMLENLAEYETPLLENIL